MKTKTYLVVLTIIFVLFCQATFAIPSQEDFYHKIYKIEWKGVSGTVLTRLEQSPESIETQYGRAYFTTPMGEHVLMHYNYTGLPSQQWIIAPISPNSSEFYIINKESGYPLMIDDNGYIRCNTSGTIDDRQRFKFKNINGDYFQIQSASTLGYFYYTYIPAWIPSGLSGIMYLACGLYYNNTATSINDDFSYFKLTEVGDIEGSENVSATNLIHQPNLLFDIPLPPSPASLTSSMPYYYNETVIGESWVPFSLIHDDAYSPGVQFAQTPYYKLVRTQAWEKVRDFPYEPGAVRTLNFKAYQGISEAETNTTQSTLEHSWSIEGKAEFEFIFIKLTLGVSYSEKLSTTITQVASYTQTTWNERDESINFNTNFPVRVVIYELVDRYYVKRMDGSNVVTPVEIKYRDYSPFLQWSSQPITMSTDPTTHITTISPAPVSPPAVPTGLAVSWGTMTLLPEISWNANSESVTYEVWGKASTASSWILVKSTTATSCLDDGMAYDADNVTYNYKIRAKNNTGIYSEYSSIVNFIHRTNYKENEAGFVGDEEYIPAEYGIFQNYPNPFNPSTVIVYDIPEAARVTLKVYDLLGREVADLVDDYKEAGRYSAKFDASRLSTGIYIYKLTANEFQSIKKMNFVK